MLSNKYGVLSIQELDWPRSEILLWRVSLSRVMGRLNEAFSSALTVDQRLQLLEEVDLVLMKWKEGLPLELRPEQQTILEGDAHLDIYMLHLDYFHLLKTTHWSLINHRGGSVRPPRLRASESICLGACLSLVRTLNM